MTYPTKAAELADWHAQQAEQRRQALGWQGEDKVTGPALRKLHADIEFHAQAAALLRASEGRVPEGLPLAVTSSPATIWLDLGFDPGEEDAHFSNLVDVTWSEDNPTGHGIKYVRADLTAAPHPPAQQAEPVAAFKVYKGDVCYKSGAEDQSFGMWCPVSIDYYPPYPEGTKFYASPPPHKAEGAEPVAWRFRWQGDANTPPTPWVYTDRASCVESARRDNWQVEALATTQEPSA